MATLHIVNRRSGLTSCLEVAAVDDSVLLIADAVSDAANPIDREIHALSNDLVSRSLTGSIAANVTLVDYAGFVDLVAGHQPIVSWR